MFPAGSLADGLLVDHTDGVTANKTKSSFFILHP